MYQTNRYSVTREPAGDGTLYVVTNLAGKVVSRHPMAYTAACQLADLYQGDDDAEAAEERLCARMDGDQ